MQRGIHKMRWIHKMRTIILAQECGQNPNPKVKKIDLYENRTTKGGEFKISKIYLRTEAPKVVSLKFAEAPKVVSLKLKNYFPKNRTTEGGESKISKAYLGTEPPKVVSLKLKVFERLT